jgi:hypothetical protein
MEQGRIIEMGTHNELTAAGGTYHRLVRTQFVDIGPTDPASLLATGTEAG